MNPYEPHLNDQDCHCRLCGPNAFEMRTAQRARELAVAR